jgi:sulfotransferase family protein
MPSAQSSADLRASGKRVPDFFIVGHEKCGTTALYEMLKRHPQIYMPALKEPHFLASDRRPRFPPPKGRTLPQTLDDYLALFAMATPQQRVGEASASYIWSHAAAGNIAALQPAARIIVIVREPASFLHSLHLQLLRAHFESKKDLMKAIALEAARREGKRIPRRCPYPMILQYSDHVAYMTQLNRYLAQFPPDQLLVLIYDDFRRDNEATVRKVLRFLEVDDEHPIEVIDANVTTRAMRSQQLDELVHSVAVGRGSIPRAAKATVKALMPRQLRRDAAGLLRRRVVLAEPSPPDERVMIELRRRFKPQVVALSEHLDRDLVALWGYDGLG